MNKNMVTFFPLRPLGFCKYRGGVLNFYVLGIGFCNYAGDTKYEVDTIWELSQIALSQ